MRRRSDLVLWSSFAAAVVLVGGTGAVAYRSVVALVRAAEWELRAQQVNGSIERL